MKFPKADYAELRPARRPGLVIRARREALNIDERTVAAAAGVSLSEYGDLESDPTDLYMTIPLVVLARVVVSVKLTLCEILQIRPCVEPLGLDSLRARRISLGLSIEEVSDQVGIFEESIIAAERDPSTLQVWRLDPILALTHALDLPLSCLLDLALADCGLTP